GDHPAHIAGDRTVAVLDVGFRGVIDRVGRSGTGKSHTGGVATSIRPTDRKRLDNGGVGGLQRDVASSGDGRVIDISPGRILDLVVGPANGNTHSRFLFGLGRVGVVGRLGTGDSEGAEEAAILRGDVELAARGKRAAGQQCRIVNSIADVGLRDTGNVIQ